MIEVKYIFPNKINISNNLNNYLQKLEQQKVNLEDDYKELQL